MAITKNPNFTLIKQLFHKQYRLLHLNLLFKIGILFFFLMTMNKKSCSAINEGNIEILTTENGLSQGTANCIFQDSKGYIWIGTNDGLNKYDAYTFKIFKHSYHNNKTISNNHILTCFEDKKGNIWIGTMGGGLSKYNPNEENFENFYFLTHNRYKTGSNIITSIAEDKEGILWLGSWGGGLLRFNPSTQSYIYFIRNQVSKNSINSNYVNAICIDNKGFLLTGTNAGLQKFDINSGVFSDLTYCLKKTNLKSSNILQITQIKGNGDEFIIVNNAQQIFKINLNNLSIISINEKIRTFQKQQYVPIAQFHSNGSDSIIFINKAKKLFTYNFKKNTLKENNYPSSTTLDFMLQELKTLYMDHTGNIWIGSNGEGLCMIPPIRKNFRTLFSNNTTTNMPIKSIRSIYEDNEFLWLGGYVGLVKYNKYSGKQFTILDKKSNHNAIVYSILQDANKDILWLGTECGGLHKFNKSTNSLKNCNAINNDICVFAMLKNTEHSIWIGSLNSIILFDTKNEKITETIFLQHFENNLKNNNTKAFALFDNDTSLWIGTDNSGLFLYHKLNKTIKNFSYNPAISGSIAGNQINSIIKDSKNNIWLGTSGGLCCYDTLNKNFKKFTTAHGLPDDMIYAIVEDDQKNLWLSTNQGICKFNPIKISARNYYVHDGISGNEFNQAAYFKGKNGEIYFGGTQGLTFFHPLQIEENKIIPKIVLKSAKKFNEDITLLLKKNNSLKLYQQNAVFNFEFTALNYYKSSLNQYAYKIIGLHDDWIQMGNSRTVTISNLNPGKYILKVIGSNNDNLWNEEGIEISIHILPPIWKTWWFRILIVLILMLGSIVFYKLRLKNITKQKAKLEILINKRTNELLLANKRYEEEIEERKKIQLALETAKLEAENANKGKSEFLANISHEIRTPMNAILGFTDLLYANAKDEKMKNYLESIRFSGKSLLKLINDILDLSKIEAGKMEIIYKSFHPYMVFKEINQIFSLSLEQKKLDFEFTIAPDFPQYIIFDEIRLRQILFNLIGNAVKFTETGSIKIEITCIYQQQQANLFDMIIKVKDTGIGIPKTAWDSIFEAFRQQDGQNTKKYGGTGLGLSITKRLTEMMAGKIWLESEEGKGTCFYLHFKNIQISNELHPITPIYSDMILTEEFIKPPLVLVAENNIEKCNILSSFLNTNKIKTIEAHNTEEVISLVKINIPEIILINTENNHFNLQLIKSELLKSLETLNIPIIAIKENATTLLPEFTDGFIYQPFNNNNLIELIHYFIPQKSANISSNAILPKNIANQTLNYKMLTQALEKIENDFLPYWKKIASSGFISEIEEFGHKIKKLGIDYNIALLEEYGNNLIQYVVNFDTENMTRLINKFDYYIEQLKKNR